MGKASTLVALDTNCFTYVLDAMRSVTAVPTGTTAAEKIALLRIYFYHPTMGAYYLSPTVWEEFKKMRPSENRDFHSSTADALFCPFPPDLDQKAIQARAHQLSVSAGHSGTADCNILAECETIGMDFLLTYDRDFNKRLAPAASGTAVMRPTEFWDELKIARGANLVSKPCDTNPLSLVDWWRW